MYKLLLTTLQDKSFWKSQKSFISKSKGFTLLELIIVIIILGIMSVGIAGFMKLSTQTYLNVSERDELLSSARFAVERLNREIRNAVPNSIRVKNDSTRQCIEFVPIIASAIYTEIPVLPDLPSNTLSVIKFQGENNSDYQCSGVCLDAVTVYPLTSGDLFANQYDATGKTFGLKSVTQITPDEWTLTLDRTSGVIFDDDSPTNRLYIIRRPVSYCVKNNSLYRYDNYGYSATQLLRPIAPETLMAENIRNINLSNLPFVLHEPTLKRNAIVQVMLNFFRDEEELVFNNDIHILNIP